MMDYPIPVTKHNHEIILRQMNNSFYNFIKEDGKDELLFFCYINYENKKFPVLVTTYEKINDLYLPKYKSINILLNNEIKKIEFGDIKYINKESNLSIIEIKDNKKNNLCKINILELDDILYEKESETKYNNKSIYVINSDKDNTTVSYGIIKNNIKSEIYYLGNKNINNKLSLIFNISTNKLIGIYKNSKKYFNKGIMLNLLIEQFISEYKHKNKNKIMNEINILIDVKKKDINRNIYFLGFNDSHKNELNKFNTKLYIDNNEIEYKKYFIPEIEGEYKIRLIFCINLIDCSYMFAECENIKKINFHSFDTKYVTSMKCMFYNCTNLTNINLLSFNIKKVTDMSFMFSSCQKLQNLDLSSFNFENAINMDYMFNSCHELKNNNIFSFNKNLIDKNYFANKSIYIKNKSKKNISIKLMVLGEMNIGKTALIERYIDGSYLILNNHPIILDYKTKNLEINGNDINIFIYYPSSNNYNSIIESFYKNMDGFLVGFDLTDNNSIDSISYYIYNIEQFRNKNFRLNLVLFGSKCDNLENIKIKEKDIVKLKEKYKAKYFNTSAKYDTNVKNLFNYMIKKALKSKKLLKEIGIIKDIPFEAIDIKEKEVQE